jgi:hypothetical protein
MRASVISAPTRSWPLKRMRPLRPRLRWRFSDIVKEDAQDERQRDFVRQEFQHQAGMPEDIAFRVKLRRLCATLQILDLGEDCLH